MFINNGADPEKQFGHFKEQFAGIYQPGTTTESGKAIPLPDLPLKPEKRRLDYEVIMKFLVECRRACLANFQRFTHASALDWGIDESACFDLGILSELIQLVPAEDPQGQRQFFARWFNDAGLKSRLPESYWRNLEKSIKPDAPIGEIGKQVAAFQSRLLNYFLQESSSIGGAGLVEKTVGTGALSTKDSNN